MQEEQVNLASSRQMYSEYFYDYNIIPCFSDYMIDEGSVARNSLLVAIYFMGGAEECARPPYYIHEVSIETFKSSYLVRMSTHGRSV